MFDDEYTFSGKHASYIKDLSRNRSGGGRGITFDRYIDVYMNGAIFGLLYGKRADKDSSVQETARIFASAFSKCREDCVFLYRLVMLLDNSVEISSSERIDRAFRYDSDSPDKLASNMELFHSYIRGGIELLHEKYSDGITTTDDCIKKIIDTMNAFNDELSEIDYAEKLAALIQD